MTITLTLSQRRALLRALDADGRRVRVASDFRAQPFRALVAKGLAREPAALAFELNAAGLAKARAINPAYRDWAPGETVAGDAERPPAGEHRAIPSSERGTRWAWIAHA